MSSPASSETIQLASGEGAIVESTGRVTFRLQNGTVEIAGRSLPGSEACSFRCARSGIHFYTLEGGTVQVTSSSSTLNITRFATPMVTLGPMIRDFVSLSSSRVVAATTASSSTTGSLAQPGSRLLIIGAKASGKTLAARTIINFLFRDAITQRRGSSSIDTATLVCGDPANTMSDMTMGPGCISSIRVTRPGISVTAPFLENAHVTFFKTASSVVSSANAATVAADSSSLSSNNNNSSNNSMEYSAQSLHWLSQALESSSAVLGSGSSITVIDAPSFSSLLTSSASSEAATSQEAIIENFYSNLIDITEPSLILFVGGVSAGASATYNPHLQSRRGGGGGQQQQNATLSSEAQQVKNLVEKINVERGGGGGGGRSSNSIISFVPVEPFVPTNQQKSSAAAAIITSNNNNRSDLIADRIEQYFCGTVDFPLKCAKLVVPLSKVFFLTISKGGSGDSSNNATTSMNNNSQSSSLAPRRVDVSKFHRQLTGRVCGVSLAATEPETAYANIAGLVLIDSIDIAENEVVFYAPAGGSGQEETCLIRPFLLVGDSSLSYSMNHASRGMDSVDANSV